MTTLRYRLAHLWSIFHIGLLLVILVPAIPTFAQDFTTEGPQVLLLDKDEQVIESGKPLFGGQALAPGQLAERTILARNESTKPARLQIAARAATGGDSALWTRDDGLQARLVDADSNTVLYQGPLHSLASGPALPLAPSKTTRLTIAVGLPERSDWSLFGEQVAVHFDFSVTP